MVPKLGISGGKPKPRNDNPVSSPILPARFKVILTITNGRIFGNTSLNMIFQAFKLLSKDALGHPFPRFFTRSRTQRSSGSVNVWKLTPSFPSRDGSARIAALNPSAVDGTTINFSTFSWAIRHPGQFDRNQARKLRSSLTPAIKMGVFLHRFPAGKQVLFTSAFGVVPSGMSLRGPDTSVDMCLCAASIEAADSDMSVSMAVGLSDPLA
jgi:hypothetical protein